MTFSTVQLVFILGPNTCRTKHLQDDQNLNLVARKQNLAQCQTLYINFYMIFQKQPWHELRGLLWVCMEPLIHFSVTVFIKVGNHQFHHDTISLDDYDICWCHKVCHDAIFSWFVISSFNSASYRRNCHHLSFQILVIKEKKINNCEAKFM